MVLVIEMEDDLTQMDLSHQWSDFLIRRVLKPGLVVTPTSSTNNLGGIQLTITRIEIDDEEILNSVIHYRMEPKKSNRRFDSSKAWWILGHTKPVKQVVVGK